MVGTGTGEVSRFFDTGGQTARLMLYVLLSVVLMAMDHQGQYVPRARSLAAQALEPIYHVVEWPVRAVRNLYGQFESRRSLRHENARLRRELLAQQGELQRLQTLQEENRRLRALFVGAESQPYDYRFAELLQVDLDPFSHRVLIDRGERDGVRAGQAVIDGGGVLGQVEDVRLHFSSVRLISDPNHALPVQINRTGLRTVAFGQGETARLSLASVPREADVRVGDLIVTSGLGERFPGGYPVAVVSAIDRGEGQTFAQVEAAPLAALDRGREVLIIHAAEPPATEGPATDGAPDAAPTNAQADEEPAETTDAPAPAAAEAGRQEGEE